MQTKHTRRQFLRSTLYSASALALTRTLGCSTNRRIAQTRPPLKPIENVRIGFVGVGSRGSHLLGILLGIENVQIKALCDILPRRVAIATQKVKQAGRPAPAAYSKGPTDFRRMCETEDLDLVITATPWRWHTPVCLSAMLNGKHAATEVPAAVTTAECWQLVETAQKTRRHCVMLENCCYGRYEMMILNMVRKGLLGDVVHAEAGYMHDLRELKFNHNACQGLWRLQHSIERDGNLYPTHGLGPVAQCMNIDRGDRFDYLVSMSTLSQGLNLYASEHFGPDHQHTTRKYALGDVNSTLIKTVRGRTIVLQHDCDTPRPYSRINIVQGSKAIVRSYPEPRIYIEGLSPTPHQWQDLEDYAAEYEHPLWKQEHARAEGSGHGGMDYMVLYRLIKCLQKGQTPDMDVYDAAAWSVVAPLTERSVAQKSRPINFPDFTKGAWKTRTPLQIIS